MTRPDSITVTFSSEDSRILDEAVTKVVANVSEDLHGAIIITTLPSEVVEGKHVNLRKLIFEEANPLLVPVLSKIDLPHNVNIFVR
jgi:ribosomal protein S10